jgi:MFS family permease
MADALATAALRRVQLSWTIAGVGSWCFFVVLAVYAFDVGGATAVGIAALVRMLPAGLAAPLAGVLVDRCARHDVVIGSLVAQAVALTAIAVAVVSGAPFAVVLGLAALFTVSSAAHRPAQAAILPALAQTPKQLGACNAVWSAIDNGAFLAGSLLGGTLIAIASVQAAFGATALLLALAVIPMALITRDPVPAHRHGSETEGALAQVLAGIRQVSAHRDLRLVVSFLTVATLVEGAVDVLVVVVAISLLGLAGDGVGWLNACWGAGGLFGGLAALGLLAHGRLAAGLAAGGLMVGVSLAMIAAFADPIVAGALLALLGVGYALIGAAGVSLLQRLSPDDLLGRAFAVVESAYWLATAAGAIIAPGIIALVGVRGALVALGAGLTFVVIVRSVALSRLEAGAVVPEREFRALRKLSVFAPLPIATVELLSRRVEHVRLEAGATVIREGDIGDRLYVIVEGRVGVEAAGRVLGVLGPGDVLGEIALLHSVPRTATATASADSLLFALGRDAFLLAIGAHASAHEAAERIATIRLDATATAYDQPQGASP